MVTGESLGKAVREIRKEKGMTQGDVIREIRKKAKFVERNFLTKIETGKLKHPRLETLEMIVKGLDIRLGGLIFFVEADMKVPIDKICESLRELEDRIDGGGATAR